MEDIAIRRDDGAQAAFHPNGSTFNELSAVLKGTFAKPTRKVGTTPYQRFRKDPYYLLKYYFTNIALLGTGIGLSQAAFGTMGDLRWSALWVVGLILFVLPSFSLIFLSGLYYLALIAIVQPQDLSWASLALVPVGVLGGTVSAALMHNAAHGNFRPEWSNRIWGEACGLFQLTGFAGWTISHFIHHAAPDNPERDAHPPGEMTFSAYVNAMGHMMKKNLTGKYFEIHGDTQHSRATWSMVDALVPLVRFLRVAFVLFLLGPTLFVMLYVPFKTANTLIYGDFNYRTHRPTGDGGYEVLNLNHTIWYKLLNAISFGSYFHKNHHRKANVFNPRYAGNDDLPLITYHR